MYVYISISLSLYIYIYTYASYLNHLSLSLYIYIHTYVYIYIYIYIAHIVALVPAPPKLRPFREGVFGMSARGFSQGALISQALVSWLVVCRILDAPNVNSTSHTLPLSFVTLNATKKTTHEQRCCFNVYVL